MSEHNRTSPYLTDLETRIPVLKGCLPDIEKSFIAIRDAFQTSHKVLLCGNGGSAADADHISGELLKGFCRQRPLSAADRKRLPEPLASKLQGGLPAIPLGGLVAASTAFANDVSPDLVYAQMVWSLGCAGDVFFGISTSGNAKNVCAAAQAARARGLVTIALTGASGGKLKELSDVAILAPASETFQIQEYHLPIYHCLSRMLEDEFFSE